MAEWRKLFAFLDSTFAAIDSRLSPGGEWPSFNDLRVHQSHGVGNARKIKSPFSPSGFLFFPARCTRTELAIGTFMVGESSSWRPRRPWTLQEVGVRESSRNMRSGRIPAIEARFAGFIRKSEARLYAVSRPFTGHSAIAYFCDASCRARQQKIGHHSHCVRTFYIIYQYNLVPYNYLHTLHIVRNQL
jgi:hypothetical protein